jgi:5-methylcytosine-specific restriction endonuclease McrA
MKKWAENNKQRSREIKQAYRARNRETERQYHAFRRLEQPEKVAAINKRYREEHPEVYTEARAARRAAELQATPRWVNRLAIQAMYAKAVFMSRQQGVPFEVDHIIPLQGEQVCGLHVACNLQILSRHENRSKSNRMLEAI